MCHTELPSKRKDWTLEGTASVLLEDGPNFSPALGRGCHNNTMHTRPHTVPSSEAERDLGMFELVLRVLYLVLSFQLKKAKLYQTDYPSENNWPLTKS